MKEGRVLVKRHQQAETDPNDKRSNERKRLHCGESTRGCRCGHSKYGSGDISSTHYDAHWRKHGSTCLTPLISPVRGYEPLFQIRQAQSGWHY